ncbi:uncharacterized protein TRUGW13939_03207 [Talaromyces rugulosus]|uniref:Uncharacterized protein n=1 Tax=Talaromyces rugulosus TaxID=121627 RepID=A0A7H8QQ72_TALRU|nr:uncharacterized protein TRUGW13939_03207 [Talaromyces rugulosus]QKX56107.1 hypothetical protein TRUGW13939_03207 [Talaromyces rugulosus]
MLEGDRFEGEWMIAAGKATGDRSGLYDCWKGAERADQRASAATMLDVGQRTVEDGVCGAVQRLKQTGASKQTSPDRDGEDKAKGEARGSDDRWWTLGVWRERAASAGR